MGSAFKLDSDGDLVHSAGRLVRVEDVQWQAQAIKTKLLMFQGEYFLDKDGEGLPWKARREGQFQLLGIKQGSETIVADYVRKSILELEFVASVEEATVSIAPVTRVMSVSFVVKNLDAEIIEDDFEVPL